MTEREFTKYYLDVPEGYNSDIRLDKYITSSIQNTSRNKVQKAIKAGYVKVNDSVEKSSYNMKPGDKINIRLPIPRLPKLNLKK